MSNLSPDSLAVSNFLASTPTPLSSNSGSSTSLVLFSLPTREKMAELHSQQNVSFNLTTYDAVSNSIAEVAYPLLNGRKVHPKDFKAYSRTHSFPLPLCFHNKAARIFLVVKEGEFEGTWCMACDKKKGDGYCPFWACITPLFTNSAISCFQYAEIKGGQRAHPYNRVSRVSSTSPQSSVNTVHSSSPNDPFFVPSTPESHANSVTIPAASYVSPSTYNSSDSDSIFSSSSLSYHSALVSPSSSGYDSSLSPVKSPRVDEPIHEPIQPIHPLPSGFSLSLPGRSRPEHLHAIRLWPAPSGGDLIQRLDAGDMEPRRPAGGYDVLLERLLLAEGVKAEEFWFAFKYCVYCDKIFLGEHVDYHPNICWKIVSRK